jgi:transcription termination factor Rho
MSFSTSSRRTPRAGGGIYGEGVLEILQDGFGFLRTPDQSYLAGPDDVYVSPSQTRRFNLRTGDYIAGRIRPPKEGGTLLRAAQGGPRQRTEPPEESKNKAHVRKLDALVPAQGAVQALSVRTSRVRPRTSPARIIDLVAPIGQRSAWRCMVSQPKTGKTMMLQQRRARHRCQPSGGCTSSSCWIDERPGGSDRNGAHACAPR